MWLTVCPGTCKISNPSPKSGNSQRSPIAKVRVFKRDARIVGADHGHFPMAQQLGHAANMIRMMVGQ